MNERLYKLFNEKNALQRYLSRRFLFNFFQPLGFHVTGNHFYDLVPDTRFVAGHYSDKPRKLEGIDWRYEACEGDTLNLVKTYGLDYKTERGRFGFTESNYYFCGLDSLMLFVFLRGLKPAKVIEVGQGASTRIALAALDINAAETGAECEFISIDPYPRLTDQLVPNGVNLRLLTRDLQSIDIKPLLADCGFLFVDSSHVYKFGSDVEHEFTQIYPHIPTGTFVHVHDVFSPYNYPLSWLLQRKQFWNEQYFLESFLSFNNAFEVALPLNLLARQSTAFADAVRSLSLGRDFRMEGCSFYFKRK